MKISKLYFTAFFLVLLPFIINSCKEEDPQPIDETIMVTVTGVSDASGCGANDGNIAATVTREGGEQFTYSVDGKNYQQNGAFANLPPGEYTILAKDEVGNIGTAEPVTILSGVSFAATIQPIISANCANSGCHDGKRGDVPNWTDKSNVIANAKKIKKQTAEKTMPPSSSDQSLTDEEIALIACWADDGAPDN